MATRVRWVMVVLIMAPLLVLSGCSCGIDTGVSVVVQDGADLVALNSAGVEVARSADDAVSWQRSGGYFGADGAGPQYDEVPAAHPLAEFEAPASDGWSLVVRPNQACEDQRCWRIEDGELREYDQSRADVAPVSVLKIADDPWERYVDEPCLPAAGVQSVMITESGTVVASMQGQGVAVRASDGEWRRDFLDGPVLSHGFGASWPTPTQTMVLPVVVSGIVGLVAVAVRWRSLRAQAFGAKEGLLIVATWAGLGFLLSIGHTAVAGFAMLTFTGGRFPAFLALASTIVLSAFIVGDVVLLSRNGRWRGGV